jgi:hypothetical protein
MRDHSTGSAGKARLGSRRASGVALALALVLPGAALLLGASPARASIIYNLTSDHCTGGCGTPPFGSVTLEQNGSDVDITVHLNPPNEFVKTSSADDMAFKFNATDVVLGDITVDQTVAGQTLAGATGDFFGDGTGMFHFGIECSTCGPGASDAFADDIVFHVANATIADLTAPNNLGNVFVADIIAGNGNTGPVDATVPVPEPGSALLVSLGLLGLAGRRRRH